MYSLADEIVELREGKKIKMLIIAGHELIPMRLQNFYS